MTDVLKKIAFLVPKVGLTQDEFTQYWRTVHGPLVARSPGYAQFRLGYAQNHVLGDIPIGAPFPWAGIAEFWLPGASANEAQFAETSVYRDRIAPDERNFIDMDATVSMTAVETAVRPGRGSAKVVLVYTSARADEFAEQALAHLSNAPGLAGWAINAVLPGSFRAPGARDVEDLTVTSVHELWFDSTEDAAKMTAALAEEQIFDPDHTLAFLAEETVFFQDGRPVGPAA